MQRFAAIALALVPQLVAAQEEAGAQLWRMASATVPTPTALATGWTAVWWNPAQLDAGSFVALELVQTPVSIGASGFVTAVGVRLHARHRVSLAYGRMSISDLVRTSLSPEAIGTGIPYSSQVGRLGWAGEIGRTTFGAALSYGQNRLDAAESDRFSVDVGLRRAFGDRVVVAASTHVLGHLASDPSQDVFAAIEVRLWRGELWTGSGQANVFARYGAAFGHGYDLDHQIGAGLNIGGVFSADVLVVAEGGYGETQLRPVAGVHLRLGRYRVLFSGDAGPRQLGAAYRVGLEARLRR